MSKYYKSTTAILPSDSPDLRKDIQQLEKLGYSVQRCTPHHIKIGPYNWFPSTGKITIDPQSRHPEKGFDAFLRLLDKPKNSFTLTAEP